MGWYHSEPSDEYWVSQFSLWNLVHIGWYHLSCRLYDCSLSRQKPNLSCGFVDVWSHRTILKWNSIGKQVYFVPWSPEVTSLEHTSSHLVISLVIRRETFVLTEMFKLVEKSSFSASLVCRKKQLLYKLLGHNLCDSDRQLAMAQDLWSKECWLDSCLVLYVEFLGKMLHLNWLSSPRGWTDTCVRYSVIWCNRLL